MGKIARIIAVTHEHTTDNLADAGRFLGRKVKGAVTAVKVEHTAYELQRNIKREEKKAREETIAKLVDEAEALAAKKRNTKSSPTTA